MPPQDGYFFFWSENASVPSSYVRSAILTDERCSPFPTEAGHFLSIPVCGVLLKPGTWAWKTGNTPDKGAISAGKKRLLAIGHWSLPEAGNGIVLIRN